MRVLIYGGGAVGLGVASCLLRSGCGLDIIARRETVDALRANGLVRTGLFGNAHAEPGAFGAYTALAEVEAPVYDLVLVCTKSFDSAAVAQDLAENKNYADTGVKLVLFQNGWGNAEVFARHFAPERIFSARVITGFHRHQPHEVEVTVHADAIHIGSLYAAEVSVLTELCQAIHQGGIPCETSPDIAKDLWAKMLYNCALNPLGAILRVPYGALATQATTQSLMNSIVGEVFAVMTAAGYRTHWETPEGFLSAFYDHLVPDTAEHESSMLQDILASKRTEIDALNGAVLKLADEATLVTPHNAAVYNLIKFVESTY
jgi:2-dehydropantoate 2-reductase